MKRVFISPGQWIEVYSSGPTPGVSYYDGVHRGFCPATPLCTLRAATAEELAAAEAEARKACRARREYAKR